MTPPRSGPTITIGDLEIEAIEKVVVRVENVWGGIVGAALKEPIAVIVRSPAGTWRVDLEHLDCGAVMNDPPPAAVGTGVHPRPPTATTPIHQQ